MRKILIYDHKFNVESISSCSQIDRSIVFYDRLPTLSFYDNFDRIKPDELWINTFFCPPNFLDNVKQNIRVKIIDYNIDYIIPNAFVNITKDQTQKTISCILQQDEPLSDKIYKYDDLYVKFYTLNHHRINHVQHCGIIDSCRGLTDIIGSSSKILFDDNICRNLCSFYNRSYAPFKQSGTVSWEQKSIKTLTNRDLFFEHVAK